MVSYHLTPISQIQDGRISE